LFGVRFSYPAFDYWEIVPSVIHPASLVASFWF
jgi:hypothetical protein